MAASRSVTHALICPMLQTQQNLLLLRLTVVRSGLSARRLFLRLIHMATAASGARSLPYIGRFESELGAAPREVFVRESPFPSSVSWALLSSSVSWPHPHRPQLPDPDRS